MRRSPPCRALIVALLGVATVAPSGALIREDSRRWSAVNESLKIRVLFTEEEVRLLPISSGSPAWEWGIALDRFGGPDGVQAAGGPLLLADDDRLDYLRGSLIEWYRDGPRGLEHGLEIPGRGDPSLLSFDFRISGRLTPKVSEDGRTVVFRDTTGAPALAFLDSHALDAEGREVAARWEWVEHAEDPGPLLRLDLDASDQSFPLRFVHLVATPKGESTITPKERPAAAITLAPAPASDLCAGSESIPPAGPFPFLSSVIDVTGATTTGDPPGPSCQPSVSRSVWFAFTPSATGAYSFSVCSDAPTATTIEDTVLAVYASAAACTGLVEMSGGCDDDSCGPTGLQSSIKSVTLTAGTTYSIVAWSYGTTAPPPGAGGIQLRVDRLSEPGPAPANDACAGAETIPGAGPFPYLSSITADISGATSAGDPAPPSCQPNVSRSIWYEFTPAESGRYIVSLCADAPGGTTVDDTVLALYSAAAVCSGFLEVAGACDDDSCAGEAAQSMLPGISLTAGTRYYIVAWEYGTTPPAAGNTSIQLRVARVASPPNDACAAATDLPLDTPVTGSTVAASDDTRLASGSPCFAGIGQNPSTAGGGDVAYRFTAPDGGRYSFRVSGYDATKNVVLYVASDCPAGAAPVMVEGCLGSANRTSVFPEEVSCLALAASQTVYVYVDEDSLTSGSAFVLEATRCSIETEPNGTPDSAGSPACGTEGSIAPAGDADFFALGIAEAGSRVFAMVDGSAGNSNDFDLRVTTGVDTLEYDDFNNDVPFGSASPNVSGTRLTGLASYLRVSHYSAAAQAEPYRLYACVQPPASGATPEVEPNDSIAAATRGSNEYYSGALSGTADVDIFSFSASAGETIQIGLDLDPSRDNTPFNGSLALLDAAGTTLLLVNDPAFSSSNLPGAGSLTATTPGSPGEAMTWRVRSTGRYYAKVAWSAGTPGDYLLSVCHDCRARTAIDGDGDGVPDDTDCAPADPSAWAVPGEAGGPVFPSPADTSRLEWSSPSAPGGAVIRFDLLRSTKAGDFQTPTCLASDTTATFGADSAAPGPIFYYLVRSENVCGGNLGSRSDGSPRTAASCP